MKPRRPNMPRQQCPRCGYWMDTADDITDKGAEPSPGDTSICLNCGDLNILLFNMHLGIPSPDAEVQMYLDATPEQLQALKAAQTAIKRRGRLYDTRPQAAHAGAYLDDHAARSLRQVAAPLPFFPPVRLR